MSELTAVGVRDSDGVRVVSESERVPFLHQWVRDYVDKRSVTDGMIVLVADIAGPEDVNSLTINALCASDRAKHENEMSDSIAIEEL